MNEKDYKAALEAVQNISKIEKKVNDVLQDRLDFSKRQNKLLEDGATELQLQLDKSNELLKIVNGQEDALKSVSDASNDILENLNEQIGVLTEQETIQKNNAIKAKERAEALLKDLEKRSIKEESIRKSLEAQNKAQGDAQKNTEIIFKTITGIGKQWEASILGDLFKSGKQGTLLSSLKGIGSGIMSMINPVNMLGNALFSAFSEGYEAQEQARAEFVKATGVVDSYDKKLADLGHNYVYLGISAKDAGEGFRSLREEFSKFAELSDDSQLSVAKFSVEMKKFGVDTRTTMKSLDIMTKAMGTSVTSSVKSQKEMFALATSIGIAPQKMMGDFERMSPRFAAFGDKMVQKFKEISVAAKRTGMDMDSLMSIAEGFDTFSAAGEHVGKLNAILRGPYLDTMEMVMSAGDPTKTLQLVKGAIDQSGLSWESMGYHQKKALASAIPGMKSVDDLSRLMKGDFNDLEEAANKQAASEEEWNKMLAKTIPLLDRLKNIGKSLAAMFLPFVTKLIGLLEWVTSGFEKLASWNQTFASIVFGVVGPALLMLIFRTSSLVKGIYGIGKAIVMAIPNLVKWVASLSSASKSIADVASASKDAIPAVKSASDALGGVAGASKDASKNLQDAAKKIAPAATPIKSVGSAAGAAAIKMLAFGAATLMFGAGIALVLWGISKVIEAMTGFVKILLDSGKLSWELVGQLALLGPALISVGIGAVAAGIGLVGLAIGFGALAISLAFIKTSDLWALSTMFQAISKFSMSTVSAISGVASAIREIAIAMDEIPEGKSFKFTQMIETAQSITTDKINNVKELVNQASRYRDLSSEQKSGTSDQFVKLIESSTKTTGNNISNGGATTINLVLEGRVLKKFILDTMDASANPRKI